MANRQKQKIITKKHLARVEREKRQKRILTYGSIAVVVLVLLLIGFGFLEENVLKYQKAIITVGDEKVTLKQFQDRAKFERLQLVNQYLKTYQYWTTIEDENTRNIFANNLKQLEFELDPTVYGQNVINKMADELVIIQEAKKRGITVTKKDVDLRLKAEFGYFPEGSPTPKATFDANPTSTLSPTQIAILSPMPETGETVTETLPATPTNTAQPTLSEPAQSPTPLPTATTYTESAFQENLETALNNLESQVGIGEEFLREYFRIELYKQRLRDEITKDVPREEEQVWARHILVSDEETAREILDKLANGEDFKDLAKEYSIDTSSAGRGGDIGWFSKGRMDEAFEKAAFSLDVGEISEPIQSSFGWHIIQVLGHEMRPLSEYRYELKRNEVFEEWLSKVRENAEVIINDEWKSYVPTEPTIEPNMLVP